MKYILNFINRGQAVRRTAASALLISFIVVSLFSEAFVSMHSEHVHERESCVVCIRVQYAENLLKRIGTAPFAATLGIIGLLFVIVIIKTMPDIYVLTLVTSKIRMNN